MKENDRLDNWLRKSLEDYRPVAGSSARDRFLAEAEISNTSSTGSSNHGKFYTLLSFVLLIAVSGLLNWQTDSSTEVIASKPLVAKQLNSNSSNERKTSYTNAENASDIAQQKSETKNETSSAKLVNYSGKVIKNQKTELDNKTIVATSAAIDIDEINSNAGETNIQPVESPETKNPTLPAIGESKSSLQNISNLQSEAEITYPLTEKTNIQRPPQDPEKKNDYNRFFNQSISLFYRPEILWNIIDNEKLAHNLGLDWNTRLFNGDYLLGTGFGLSFTKGYYEYAVEYKEFLGNYTRLDSITFNWNAREFSMEQTMHTSEEEVFDTAVTTDYARVYRKFTYLQIPLTLGYDVVRTGNTTLGFRFAPVLSVLLAKKPVDFRYETGQNKLVQVNRITPDRVRTNWQLNAGINYGRRLTESLWLEFEPRITYYFNSVYEKSDNSSSPMGASIRVAVGIKY